ncbi:methylenetetrahydrofolate reductase [Stenotrophomonas sp.]|uniref:methylenetetrahydrofolate reductase n=1 Tax=Stenotrophomonas sp. TaxID=69392 RepID=UPI0028A8B710|nr:methylenetetrahydrofolate reductase [Stenotrophomonas sp.]
MQAIALTGDYSLEAGGNAIAALRGVAARLTPGTRIFIPYLGSEDDAARLSAAVAIRSLGLVPTLHLAARRIVSKAALASFLERAVGEAGVDSCLVIAGDPSRSLGPFEDSSALIESGVLQCPGIRMIGVGGHPDGHPAMTAAQCWEVLERKCQRIEMQGLKPLIVTQFAFDAEPVLQWLLALRARGIDCPVRVGVPGPAGAAVLARYAAVCGVAASASMLSRYGLSIGRLFGMTGPDSFVDRLAAGLGPAHGDVGLHFYPFGGVAQSVKWIEEYRRRNRPQGWGG